MTEIYRPTPDERSKIKIKPEDVAKLGVNEGRIK